MSKVGHGKILKGYYFAIVGNQVNNETWCTSFLVEYIPVKKSILFILFGFFLLVTFRVIFLVSFFGSYRFWILICFFKLKTNLTTGRYTY